jgi:hypothetical protein
MVVLSPRQAPDHKPATSASGTIPISVQVGEGEAGNSMPRSSCGSVPFSLAPAPALKPMAQVGDKFSPSRLCRLDLKYHPGHRRTSPNWPHHNGMSLQGLLEVRTRGSCMTDQGSHVAQIRNYNRRRPTQGPELSPG